MPKKITLEEIQQLREDFIKTYDKECIEDKITSWRAEGKTWDEINVLRKQLNLYSKEAAFAWHLNEYLWKNGYYENKI